MAYFTFKKLDPDDCLFGQIFKLRYQVYIEDWKFERPEDHPGGIERNEYDDQAIHIAAISNDDQSVIGTARLILHSENDFPLEENMQITKTITLEKKERACEISRLCIRRDYSRRIEDKLLSGLDVDEAELKKAELAKEMRRPENDILLGLIKCMAKESRVNRLEYWYVAMAKSLRLLLRRRGIEFEQAGPEMDYHGLRAPYFGKIDQILAKNRVLNNIYLGVEDFSYDQDNPIIL